MSQQHHHIFYVPGILDDIYHVQSTVVRSWRLYGVHGHCHVMPWLGQASYEVKFQQLLDAIDTHLAAGHMVSLVGASAGASAVLNAYAVRLDKLSGVVLLCPKINYPETVSAKTYRENPAFKTSLNQLQDNLAKLTRHQNAKRILSYYSPADGTIPYEASALPGVLEKRLPPLRHPRAIFYGISFGAADFIRFLKHLS